MKRLCLILSLCMILCIMPVSAEQTLWTGFDAQNVVNGTDSYWTTGLSVHTHATNGKGLIAPLGNRTMTSSDPAFASTTVNKREWGPLKAQNAITSSMADKYEIRFKLTGIEGMYATPFGGWYVYLRSSTLGSYLDNRFAIILRRNQTGTTQIGLKTATQGATTDTYLPIGVSGVTLLDTDIKIVDSFTDNEINVYATDSNGMYQLIGTVTLNLTTKSATLTNAAGSTLTRTGYGETISGTSSTPMFITAENSIMLSHLSVKYPLIELNGATASVPSGSFTEIPETELATEDEDAVIYYTTDGTDPRDSVTAEEYAGGAINFGDVEDEYPLTLKLKAVTYLNGEYSNVSSYIYKIIAPSASYPLDPAMLETATDPYWTGKVPFVVTSFDGEEGVKDAVTNPEINAWTFLTPKFTMPAVVETYEYRFTMKNLVNDGFRKSGIYIPIKAAELDNYMTDAQKAFVVIAPGGIGIRNGNAWGHHAFEKLPYPDGINVTNSTYTVRVFVTPGDTEETVKVFFDNTLVGTYSLDGEDFTLTNAAGDTITRDGIVTVADNFVPSMSITFSNPLIKDFSLFYPAENRNMDVDKTDLGELIEEVKTLNGEEFDGESFGAVLYALKPAEKVFANAFVYQEQADEAYSALLEAKNALIPINPQYETLFDEDFEETTTNELKAVDWKFALPVHEFVSDGALTTDGYNGRFAMTPVIPVDSTAEMYVKYGTAEAAAVMLRQNADNQTYLNSYRDAEEKYFGSEGITLHIKAEGMASDELCIAFPEGEGTGFETFAVKLPENVTFADFEKITVTDRGGYIELYVADEMLANIVFCEKENGAFTGAMILDGNENVIGYAQGINVAESGRTVFASKGGTMVADSISCVSDISRAEVENIAVFCTNVTLYGQGKLSAVAEYDNGVKADLAEGVTYTSLTENIAVVEGDVARGVATGTATIKAEYQDAHGETTVEVTAIPLAAVENETDAPIAITEAQAENYEKVFYAYESANITVPSGNAGEVEIYIRAEGEGIATVKVNGAVSEEIDVSNLQNYKMTASFEKGLNTLEIITETEVSGVYVQKIAGTLPERLLTDITLSKSSYSFVVTDEGEALPDVTAYYFDGDSCEADATFTSENPGIAVVENGKIVPAGNDGETVITVAVTDGGITRQAEITVSVTLSENIVVLNGITTAEANATKGYSEGIYSENSKPQFAIDGENGTVWTSGGAGEFLAGHESDEAVYFAVKLDGLHSAERIMLSLADETVDTGKILGVWIDTRRMEGLSPYANEGSLVFVDKSELTLLVDEIGKTVKLVFDEPKVVQYVAVAFDKSAEISVKEIKLYEDTDVPATEEAESLSFENELISEGEVALTRGDEIAVVLKKNYPRLDSAVVATYTSTSTASATARIEGGVLKTDVAGEAVVSATADGLTAQLKVKVLPMADIICLNPEAFINMQAGDEAIIELNEGLNKIRFLSENTSVVTVDGEGNVTAAGNGRTKIKIYSDVSDVECVYISINVGDEAESDMIISEDFEGETTLPDDWSYFVWQGENRQAIETVEGENYLNVGRDWVGGAIPNAVITAEKYTVETNAGISGPDGIIYIRLPEIMSNVLAYTGETDYSTSGWRYGRDGIAFNLLGNSSFGITFRTKEVDSRDYPKAVNIAVPIPEELSFPDGTFADFRFDDTGDNVYVSVNGQPVCTIVFTDVETDSADSARVLADGYVEDAKGEKLGVFNDVSLPGSNYKVGFGSRKQSLYINSLTVTDSPLPGIANTGDFKVVELGAASKKISVTRFGESFTEGVEYESANPSVAAVDEQGNVSFAGRGTTVIYVYTPSGNLHVPVSVLGAEDIRGIAAKITDTASYEEATALYAQLEAEYGLDFSEITNEELSGRLKEETALGRAESYSKLADIQSKILFAKKVAQVAEAASAVGSGDKLEKALMPSKTDFDLDTTDYDKINSDNICGEMWKALYTELKELDSINSAVIKEKFESFAGDYLDKYLESQSDPDVGGGSSGSTGGMTYVDYTEVVQPAKAYFTDLASGHWAKTYIEALAEQGIVSGYADKTVNPDGRITREEAVTVIIKAFIKKTAEGTLAEGDPSSEWAVPYLLSAKENGLLVGDDKGFINGKNNATRAEMAVLIARLMGMNEAGTENLSSFSDSVNIPRWAQGAFAGLNAKGIISGYEDGTLRPGGYITRAEFFTMIYNIIKNN